MSDQKPGKSAPAAAPQRFQQFDADAVCERCGSVNDDGTLICKVCGQNLRDQRSKRLAGAPAAEAVETKVSRSRIATGVLSVVGILLVVMAAVSIRRIEAGLTSVLSEAPIVTGVDEELWSGPSLAIYDELSAVLRDYPATPEQIQDALENPVTESSYNGRYMLLLAGALNANRVMGEAELRRRGDRVYFVAFLREPSVEVRGFARLEEVQEENSEGAVPRPVVRNTAGYIAETGEEVRGFGFSEPLDTGGHRVIAMQRAASADEADLQTEIFAYRIR